MDLTVMYTVFPLNFTLQQEISGELVFSMGIELKSLSVKSTSFVTDPFKL